MKFACVLRSGGEFGPGHVADLARGILEHHPEAEIHCLTDMALDFQGVTTVPLKHGWRGWWSKLELFRPGLFDGPTLYMDLDSVVIGRIQVDCEQFTMLPNVYRRGDYGSGIMSWRQPPVHIYEKFARNPARWMAIYRTTQRWGDQGFIRDSLGHKPRTFGEQFRSYKAHCQHQVPAGTSVVYFHGKPRPWQVQLRIPN